jgi:GH25 family lysozyme M1 (1,4-beta-N-acetylmuramidase)
MVRGIDVSNHQPNIDWERVHDQGDVDVAYLKATEGKDFVDAYYDDHRREANAAGVTVGAYDFARPGSKSSDPRTDARLEAEHFLRVADVRPGDLAPVLDLEDDGGLTPEQLSVWTETWIDAVSEATGTKPVVYTSPGFWETEVGADSDIARKADLWVAHWGVDSPDVPGSFQGWQVWQQTSDGTVPGIDGRVDVNTFKDPSQITVAGGTPEQRTEQRPEQRTEQRPEQRTEQRPRPVSQITPDDPEACSEPTAPPAPAPAAAPVQQTVVQQAPAPVAQQAPPADPTVVPQDPSQAYAATASCCCCCG